MSGPTRYEYGWIFSARTTAFAIMCIIEPGKEAIVHPYCAPRLFFLCSMYTGLTIIGSLFFFHFPQDTGP